MQDQNTAQVVNQLFERLIAINPAFKQAWPTEHEFKATKREWVSAFIDARINTIEHLKKGLAKIRMNPSPFIPTPGEFIAMCQPGPEDIGAPDIESAYSEACLKAHPQTWTKDFSHAAVKHAYQRTGNGSFLNESADKVYKKFEANYLQACIDYAAGKIMDQIENENKNPIGKSDIDGPCEEYGFEFARPGVLKQYAHLKGYEDSMAEIRKILKQKPNKGLEKFVNKLEEEYLNT